MLRAIVLFLPLILCVAAQYRQYNADNRVENSGKSKINYDATNSQPMYQPRSYIKLPARTWSAQPTEAPIPAPAPAPVQRVSYGPVQIAPQPLIDSPPAPLAKSAHPLEHLPPLLPKLEPDQRTVFIKHYQPATVQIETNPSPVKVQAQPIYVPTQAPFVDDRPLPTRPIQPIPRAIPRPLPTIPVQTVPGPIPRPLPTRPVRPIPQPILRLWQRPKQPIIKYVPGPILPTLPTYLVPSIQGLPFYNNASIIYVVMYGQPPAILPPQPTIEIAPQPPVEVVTRPPVKIAPQPPLEVVTSQPERIVAQRPVEIATQPPVEVVTRPPVKIAPQPPLEVVTIQPKRIVAQRPVEIVTQPPVHIASQPPVDILPAPIADLAHPLKHLPTLLPKPEADRRPAFIKHYQPTPVQIETEPSLVIVPTQAPPIYVPTQPPIPAPKPKYVPLMSRPIIRPLPTRFVRPIPQPIPSPGQRPKQPIIKYVPGPTSPTIPTPLVPSIQGLPCHDNASIIYVVMYGQPPAILPPQPTIEIAPQPPVEVVTRPPVKIAPQPPLEVVTSQPERIVAQRPVEIATQPPVQIAPQPPVDILPAPIANSAHQLKHLPTLLPQPVADRRPAFITYYQPPPVQIQTKPSSVKVPTQAPPIYIPIQAPTQPPAPAPTPKYVPIDSRPILRPLNFACPEDNGFYAIDKECDTYIQCENRIATMQNCPDGLHFNFAAKWNEQPCGYPALVKCAAGSFEQSSSTTTQCPKQYGLFSMNDGDCSKYIMCHKGIASIMNCPAGLVFNTAIDNCDWPESVPECNLKVLRNYTCPEAPLDANGAVSDVVYKYRYENQCKFFIACHKGFPRLLSCDPGLAFNEASQSCIADAQAADCNTPTLYRNSSGTT